MLRWGRHCQATPTPGVTDASRASCWRGMHDMVCFPGAVDRHSDGADSVARHKRRSVQRGPPAPRQSLDPRIPWIATTKDAEPAKRRTDICAALLFSLFSLLSLILRACVCVCMRACVAYRCRQRRRADFFGEMPHGKGRTPTPQSSSRAGRVCRSAPRPRRRAPIGRGSQVCSLSLSRALQLLRCTPHVFAQCCL